MRALSTVFALSLVGVVLVDVFYTVVLARRTERSIRVAGLFYRVTWRLYKAIGRRIESGKRREDYLSVYGPFSLLALLGCWAAAIIIAFGILHWSAGLQVRGTRAGLEDALYFSGTTLFAVGTPDAQNAVSRLLNVIEAGLGISFLGLVIGYLPVLYQAYSSRELHIFLFDARAGSPPSACELLQRQSKNADKLEAQLKAWEEWAAELVQSHLSYPMLSYFRSQHTNQSWLSTLVSIVDASVLLSLSSGDDLARQAERTFAMGRHAVVDLSRVFHSRPSPPPENRLVPGDFERLKDAAMRLAPTTADRLTLEELNRCREMYEAHAHALETFFLMALPRWAPEQRKQDNWKATKSLPADPEFSVSDPFTDPEPGE